jgi:hypothetical protein
MKSHKETALFFTDLQFSETIVRFCELLITGDLNFHLDDSNDIYSRKLIETLQDHGLQQHVIGPTHVRGHRSIARYFLKVTVLRIFGGFAMHNLVNIVK